VNERDEEAERKERNECAGFHWREFTTDEITNRRPP
jgi:hypothetical protein